MTFTHVAMGGDPARGAKRFVLFEFFPDFRDRPRYLEGLAERFNSAGSQRFQLFAPLRDQFIFRLHASRVWNALFSYRASRESCWG
jgi:hypothetical protein